MSWNPLVMMTGRRESRFTELDHLRFATTVGLSVAVAIGLLVVWLHGGVVTASISAFGASMGTGGVLGFLFGVPSTSRASSRAPVSIDNAAHVTVGGGELSKTTVNEAGDGQGAAAPKPPSPALPAEVSSASTAPVTQVSNLEQVADWVTKLLLGGGLTQMQRIPPKVWQWSRVVALGILGKQTNLTDADVLPEQSFAAGLMVYSFVLGFFAGFLITKLQLGRAISDS